MTDYYAADVTLTLGEDGYESVGEIVIVDSAEVDRTVYLFTTFTPALSGGGFNSPWVPFRMWMSSDPNSNDLSGGRCAVVLPAGAQVLAQTLTFTSGSLGGLGWPSNAPWYPASPPFALSTVHVLATKVGSYLSDAQAIASGTAINVATDLVFDSVEYDRVITRVGGTLFGLIGFTEETCTFQAAPIQRLVLPAGEQFWGPSGYDFIATKLAPTEE